MKILRMAAIPGLVLMLVAGCATKSNVEPQFGNAVRQVTDAQIYDADAAANPDPAAVLGGDPERLNNTLSGHRKDVASPSSVDSPVTINVGGSEK